MTNIDKTFIAFVVEGVIPNEVTDFEGMSACIRRLPDETEYKAIGLTIGRTQTGLTFSAKTPLGKTEALAVTFEEIDLVITKKLMVEQNGLMKRIEPAYTISRK